jgi:hypothetical protein
LYREVWYRLVSAQDKGCFALALFPGSSRVISGHEVVVCLSAAASPSPMAAPPLLRFFTKDPVGRTLETRPDGLLARKQSEWPGSFSPIVLAPVAPTPHTVTHRAAVLVLLIRELLPELSRLVVDYLPLEFKHHAGWDKNGLLYWLGTQKGTTPWQNPARAGWLTITMSSILNNRGLTPATLANNSGMFGTCSTKWGVTTIGFSSTLVRIWWFRRRRARA